MVFSAIPQVITEDRASGAHIVDGSLAINNDRNQYLRKSFSNEGNTRTFTWSSWVKRSSFGDWQRIFTCEPGSNLIAGLSFAGAVSGSYPIDGIRLQQQDTDGNNNHFRTTSVYRDTGWYHIVMRVDTTSGTPGDRVRLYVNGELAPGGWSAGNIPSQNSRYYYNRTNNYHEIGHSTQYNAYYDGRMTQCYWIDGQSLGPENFGFSDPLTNTWRPKKYEQLGPNNGTTWSAGTLSGSIEGVRPWALGFDGREDTFTRPTNNQMASIMFDTPINFSSKFEIKGALDSGNTGSIEVYDGTDAWINVSSSFGTYAQSYDYPRVDITSSITSPVKGIRFNGVSAASQPRFTGIYVDNQILIDGDTSNMGRNGFYLPMDGSAPIGKDQSGRGNDWTSINIGGSVELPKATGAIPILDTNEAGNVAKLNARTDKKTYTVTASGGNYYIDGALKPTLNAYRGGTYTFDYTGATSHPFYLSGMPDGKWNSKAYSVEFNGSDQYLTHPNDNTITDWSSGDYTIELWAYFDSFAVGANTNTHLIGAAAIDSGAESWSLGPNSSGQVVWYYWNGTQQRVTGGTITTGRWYHLAMTHSGGVIRIFIDGNLSTTASVNGTPQTSTLPLRIGKITNSSSFDGYVSNVRIVRGSAVYTSNFTPPGTTLTNITNTTFLACQDSDATTAPVAPGTITATGAAASQSRQPFLYDNNHGNFGVNTGTSNTTKITIPHLAADTLYYYCNAHSGMGSSINVTTDIRKADPYAWKCVLALPLDGSTSVFSANDVRDQLNCNETAKSFNTNGNAAALTPNPNFYGTGGFSFDGSGDYLQTAYDEDFNFGSEDFTVEAWAKSTQSNSYAPIVGRWTSAQNTAAWDLRLSTNDFGNRASFITRQDNGGNGGTFRVIDSGFNANDGYWHHIAACRTGNTIKIFIDGDEKVSGSYPYKINTNTGQPLRVGYNDSHYYNGRIQDVRIYKGVAKYTENFAPASTDPEVLPDTPSGIPLKTQLKEVPTTDGGSIAFGPAQSDYLRLDDDADTRLTNTFSIELFYHEANSRTAGAFITDGGGSTNPVASGTTNGISYQFYHNAGAIYLNWSNGSGTWYNINNVNMPASVGWHHVVVTNDNTRTRMFIDGVIVGGHSHHDWGVASSGRKVYIGTMSAGPGTGTQGSYNSHGYISNIRICNGSVPTEYATTETASGTKVFNPPSAPLTTTSQGANSSHVKLLCAQSQTSPTTATVSPSSITKFNNVYASKFNPFTDGINIIRGQESGYATFNPLQKNSGVTLSNGNLKLQTTSNAWKATQTTIGMKTGKFYWEFGPQLWRDNNNHCQPGVAAMGLGNAYEMGGTNYTAFYHYTGSKYFNASQDSFGAAWNDSEHNIIGIAFDADTRKVWFSKNGIWQDAGDPANGTNEAGILNLYGDGTYAPTLGSYGGLNGGGADANFGQKPFKFPPPDGFQPLSLSNTQPEKVIARSEQYVGVKTYSGSTGTGTIEDENIEFTPDFVWVKDRTGTEPHALYDTVRGAAGNGNFYRLSTNSPNGNNSPTNELTSMIRGGFTANNNGHIFSNGKNYVSWMWKAGGNKNIFNVDDVGYASAAAAGLDGGTITPIGASVGTEQGFSILKYQGNGTAGASISHGLSEAPKLMIHKSLDQSRNWYTIYNDGTSQMQYLYLNLTNNILNSAVSAPTSNVMHFTGSAESNNSGENYIVYMWHDVPGLQKFGTFVGNGSEGSFIELGFRPAIVLMKNTTRNDGPWLIHDSTRYPQNPSIHTMEPHTSDTEASSPVSREIDMLSNGFRTRGTSVAINEDGSTIFYAAWAEAPSINLYGAQANAR